MSRLPETSVGGANERFPDTQWSVIRASVRQPAAAAPPQLDVLVRQYWKPVYALIRRSFDLPIEDAKDLTQDFFARILERSFLEQADPTRGAFRAFVKVAVQNFVRQHLRNLSAYKRTGGQRTQSLDGTDVEGLIRDHATESPDALFDRAWTRTVLDLAAERLDRELRAEGRASQADAFRAHYVDGLPYAGISKKLRITESIVANHLFACRRRYREAIEKIVAETVADPAELNDEIRRLF